MGGSNPGGGEEWVVGQCSLHIRTNQAFVDLLMHWVTCYWLLNAIALGLAGSDCGTVRSTVNKGWSSLEAECWSAAWQHRKRRGVNFKSLLVRYSQTAQLVWSQNNVKKIKKQLRVITLRLVGCMWSTGSSRKAVAFKTVRNCTCSWSYNDTNKQNAIS